MAETIRAHGCSIVLKRQESPEARELFLHCQPPTDVADPGLQAAALYRAALAREPNLPDAVHMLGAIELVHARNRPVLGPASTSHANSRLTSAGFPKRRVCVTDTPAIMIGSAPFLVFILQILA